MKLKPKHLILAWLMILSAFTALNSSLILQLRMSIPL